MSANNKLVLYDSCKTK